MCLSHRHKIWKWYNQSLLCCHRAKVCNFARKSIRTQPLFSPSCVSATYGSARMCRRKNWQSPCTALMAGKCPPLRLCKETVKGSTHPLSNWEKHTSAKFQKIVHMFYAYCVLPWFGTHILQGYHSLPLEQSCLKQITPPHQEQWYN